VRWCRRCILPDSRPGLVLGEDGVCSACRQHAARTAIDWAARRETLRDVVSSARSRSHGYDCVVPVSGGKDSTWQVVTCLELGLKPLAVTWKTPGRTEVGQRNLDNLVRIGVDHIDYQIDPRVEARFMVKAFERHGSTAIPMHLALFAIPLTIAVRFEIPLLVWGENSAIEYGNLEEERAGFKLDRSWLQSYGVTHGTTARDWVDDDLGEKELLAYFGPDPDVAEALGVRGIFLGYYLPWDPATSYEVAQRHGFQADPGGARTGLYDYADIDDRFISIHHWMKWYKFGFTRLFDNLSLEIRNGRVSREEAIDIVAGHGEQRPVRDIASFCSFAGVEESWFYDVAERFRDRSIWQRDETGRWTIPGFLVPDWRWS